MPFLELIMHSKFHCDSLLGTMGGHLGTCLEGWENGSTAANPERVRAAGPVVPLRLLDADWQIYLGDTSLVPKGMVVDLRSQSNGWQLCAARCRPFISPKPDKNKQTKMNVD